MKINLITDSVANNIRISTFILEYPRLIHAELLTHRVFSRNSASSRAIPTKAIIANLRKDPADIVWWGKQMSGMQAKEQLSGMQLLAAKALWRTGMELAILGALLFTAVGLHKQLANRILETFQNIRVVVTSTEWNNFLALRDHPDAQPELAAVAAEIAKQLKNSKPQKLKPGQWHMPYIDTYDIDGEQKFGIWEDDDQGINLKFKELTLEQALKVSASLAAQESYRKSDPSLEKAEAIWERLVLSKPVHCFGGDTEVLTQSGFKYWKDVTPNDQLADVDIHTGKFINWSNPLDLIKGFHTGKMYSVDAKDISFNVTDGHKMLGHLVSDQFSRYSTFTPTPFIIGDPTSSKHSKNTLGEVECRMLTAPIVENKLTALGKLIGMYIGDGFKLDKTIGFHFKKERKIAYLINTLAELNLEYSVRMNSDGTTMFRVFQCTTTEQILSECGDNTCIKRLGKWDLEHLPGIFDGLKNSDGSVKRNTWTYCTVSPQLNEDILNFAPIAGLTIRENKIQKGCYKFMVQTTNVGKINDSRIETSKVKITEVVNELVYCATMPSGALIVRRNGKVLITGNSSPTEHQAMAMRQPKLKGMITDSGWEEGATHVDKHRNFWSANFRGFIQHRQLIPNHHVPG